MARPLMRHSIVELEQLFSIAKDDSKALKGLEDELKHRNVPRAVALLDQVQRSLRTSKPSPKLPEVSQSVAKPSESSTNRKDSLRGEEPKWQPKIGMATKVDPPTNPMPEEAPTGQPIRPSASLAQHVKPVERMPSMSVDEAYKVLKATPGSTWEEIEQTRRQIVQLAHPEKVAGLGDDQRAHVQADANRVNAAYAVLLHGLLPASKTRC